MAAFYMSFADEKGFLGGLHVKGDDILVNVDALATATRMGLYPGGEVMFMPIVRPEHVPDEYWFRLMDRRELENLDRMMCDKWGAA